MSKVNKQTLDLAAVQREAVAWVQKLISGDVTADDRQELNTWRAQSQAHADAFAEAKRVWGEVGPAGRILRSRGGEFATDLDTLGQRRRIMNRRVVLGSGLAAVAAVAGYAAISPPLGLWPSLSEMRADYRTGTGEQRTVAFASDISIDLNTQTSIAVRPTEKESDQIELIAGEAAFTISTHASRSLVVLAGAGKTVSASARFDVRYMMSSPRTPVNVVCFEGKIRIEHGSDARELQPGQQIRYDVDGLGQIATVDPEIASDWQRGIVVFRATPLTEAIEEINRYRPGRIILRSAALGQKQLSGRFRINQMDEVLSRLEQAFNARIQRLPGGIVLLS